MIQSQPVISSEMYIVYSKLKFISTILKKIILDYAHDFCNWNVRENISEIAMIAHNLFGFDVLFFIKGYHALHVVQKM